MRRKLFCIILLALIIAVNFFEISIPFINTTNEVNAGGVWGAGRAYYWFAPEQCSYCGLFWDGSCVKTILGPGMRICGEH